MLMGPAFVVHRSFDVRLLVAKLHPIIGLHNLSRMIGDIRDNSVLSVNCGKWLTETLSVRKVRQNDS